jgi:hypothetical protein
MYELYQLVKDNPKYYVRVLGADKTRDNDGNRIISDQQIEESKAMGMSEEKCQQEWFCNWEIGNQGAYLTSEVHLMQAENRIRKIKPIPHLPLMLSADLGGVDATCFLLFQIVGNDIHILFMIHANGKGLKWYMEEAEKYRKKIGCQWGHMFMPHDVKQAHQGWEQAESRLMQARKAGWHFLVTPKLSVEDGIETMRHSMKVTHIDKDNCELFIRALREYQREYDELKKMYAQKPLHNWASHLVDAYRYLSINHRRLFAVPERITSYTTNM